MLNRMVMWLVMVPLGLLLALFALANRQIIQLGFDPVAPQNPLFGPMEVPLFVVIYGALLLGVVLGGFSSWLAQGRRRKVERRLRRDLDSLQKRDAQRSDAENAGTPSLPGTHAR